MVICLVVCDQIGVLDVKDSTMNHACDRHHLLLEKLIALPRHIVATHGTENLAEFILHELCDDDCFALRKAAFFVDNPDFNCLKGVAGIDGAQRFEQRAWEDQDAFTGHMSQVPFNQQVRLVHRPSAHRKDHSWQREAADLAQEIDVRDHEWHVFPIKHGNTGVLIFEPSSSWQAYDDLIGCGAALLALCPIF